jgi:hypothetical protein
LIIIKDLFSNPKEVIEFAKSNKFYSLEEHPLDAGTHITWSGKKTMFLDKSHPFVINILNQIIDNLPFDVNINNTVSLFHSFDKNDISNRTWFHTDNTSFGGVIYINDIQPEYPENHGTCVLKDGVDFYVPYEYNKLVMYPSSYVHRPMNGFGDTLEDSRLTLNFFIR